MSIYTSRYFNPELKKGYYTAVRISIGTPRWELGYTIAGEIKDLMPFGLLGKYDNDMAAFKAEYFAKLEKAGADKIFKQLMHFEKAGKDVVLLCYEDVRKGENDWCHRVMFAEWWLEKTGEVVAELPDPSTPKVPKPPKSAFKTTNEINLIQPLPEQLSLI